MEFSAMEGYLKKLPNRCFKITSNNFLFLIRIFVNFYHHFGDCPRWSSMDFARLDGGGLPTARSVAARICLVSHGAFKRRRGRPMFRSETCQKYGKGLQETLVSLVEISCDGLFHAARTTVTCKKILKQVDSWGGLVLLLLNKYWIAPMKG